MKACKMVSVVAVALGGMLLLPLEGARDDRGSRGGQVRVHRGGNSGHFHQPRAVHTRRMDHRHYRNPHTYRRGDVRRYDNRVARRAHRHHRWANSHRYHGQRYPRTVWYSYPSYSSYYPNYSGNAYYQSAPYGAGYDGYYAYRVPRAVRVYATELPPVAGSLEVEVQLALRRLGFYRGPIDGVMGRGTWRAIRAFRASVGLPVRSDVDGELLRALGFSY